MALPRADVSTLALWPEIGAANGTSLAFALALADWMPSAIDISV